MVYTYIIIFATPNALRSLLNLFQTTIKFVTNVLTIALDAHLQHSA